MTTDPILDDPDFRPIHARHMTEPGRFTDSWQPSSDPIPEGKMPSAARLFGLAAAAMGYPDALLDSPPDFFAFTHQELIAFARAVLAATLEARP